MQKKEKFSKKSKVEKNSTKKRIMIS